MPQLLPMLFLLKKLLNISFQQLSSWPSNQHQLTQEDTTNPSPTKFSYRSCSQGQLHESLVGKGKNKMHIFFSYLFKQRPMPLKYFPCSFSSRKHPHKFSTLLHDGLPNQPTHQPCQKIPSTLHLNSQTTHVPTR